MDRSHNISNRLKHRIAQMLLTSSCTTTTIMNISEKISQEPGFPFSDVLHVHRGGELDQRPHRVAPAVQVSIDCSGRRSIHASHSPNLPLTPEENNRYQKKERRVAETGAGEGRKCPPASPSLPSNDNYYYSQSKQRKKAMAEKKNKFVSKKKKPLSNGYGISGSSSIGSNDEFGFFSSEEGEEEEEEEEEETWTLFSSKSFSSDSSEFYHRPSSKKTTKHKKSTRRPPRRGARYFEESRDEGSKFQPLIPISSKKKPPKAAEARTGFAVVKQSTNPYEDFRSSMVEMITEREMREPEDLEQLLHSYLSLNSPCHHPAILEAFADLWEAIFRQL